jgi:hypothetical protein
MAIDTFIAYVGVYPSVADANADYDLVKALHTEAGLIDAYDAAVVERRPDGKVQIAKKHETPTRMGGVLGAGAGLATGLVVALFPRGDRGGLLAATQAGRARAVAGRAAAGMVADASRTWASRSTPVKPASWSWPSRTCAPGRGRDEPRRKVRDQGLKADTAGIERDASGGAGGGAAAG